MCPCSVDALHGRAHLPDDDAEEGDAAGAGTKGGDAGADGEEDGDEVPEMLVPSKTVYSRERKDVLAFLLEMCNTAKAVMQTVRIKFFRCVCPRQTLPRPRPPSARCSDLCCPLFPLSQCTRRCVRPHSTCV